MLTSKWVVQVHDKHPMDEDLEMDVWQNKKIAYKQAVDESLRVSLAAGFCVKLNKTNNMAMEFSRGSSKWSVSDLYQRVM